MTRRQRDEYDKKIAGALRKYLSEEGLSEAADAAAAPAEAPADGGTWLEKPLARAKTKQFFRGLGRAAALFLLVLMAGFGTACAASAEVRASVGSAWKQLFERWDGEWEEPKEDQIRIPNYYQSVSYTDEENDWYYTITYIGIPGDSNPQFALFTGVDLRHRFADDSWSETLQTGFDNAGNRTYQINRVRSQMIYFGRTDAEKRDRKKVQEILEKVIDPATNGGDPDPADYSFEVLDKEMFFDLLQRSLVDAPVYALEKERDDYLPPIGAFAEPEWQDGYRFQIIMAEMKSQIRESYIDVLYKTGEAYNDYVQLSDLVEEGKANADQQKLFSLLQEVRTAIKENNNFLAMKTELKEAAFEGIDLGRLITFLTDLETAGLDNLNIYYEKSSDLPDEIVFISREEWEERLREDGIDPEENESEQKLEQRREK